MIESRSRYTAVQCNGVCVCIHRVTLMAFNVYECVSGCVCVSAAASLLTDEERQSLTSCCCLSSDVKISSRNGIKLTLEGKAQCVCVSVCVTILSILKYSLIIIHVGDDHHLDLTGISSPIFCLFDCSTGDLITNKKQQHTHAEPHPPTRCSLFLSVSIAGLCHRR